MSCIYKFNVIQNLSNTKNLSQNVSKKLCTPSVLYRYL